MLYTPIHFAVFLIICFLLPTLLYSSYCLHTLYLVLGDAYIDVSLTSSSHPSLTETLCLVHVIAWQREGLL